MAMEPLGEPNPQQRFTCPIDPVGLDDMLAVAKGFSWTDLPINGLRHPRTEGLSGWYLWSSETFPEADDAFEVHHVRHLTHQCPEIMAYLALPAGWRFLLAPGYEDVWPDDSLLDV
ncbi:hypothetical protein ABT297_12315 [Dactylosporangium sp. NPDC000555]|uniref:immunity protein Imm33 domain-containing protein n=1 Tax=Dactylosporangium sp. NPDC000555 TaxID=3154260 RepID=UPI00332ACE4D